MRTVRNDALHQAGECVQDAGRLPAIQVEALGNVFGYRSGGNNGDGVVCRTEVGDADKCGDAQFCSSFAFYMARQAGDDEVDSAIVADRFQHTAGKQGDDNQFTHSCDAGSHGAEPVEESCAQVCFACEDTDDTCAQDTQEQD